VSGIICGFAGSRARVRLFYTHCNFTREHNVKPAPVLVGTNTNPYPHPTGFLPAGKRVICARCHPYSPELAPPRQPPPAAVDPPRRQPPHPNSDHPSTLGEPTVTPHRLPGRERGRLAGIRPAPPPPTAEGINCTSLIFCRGLGDKFHLL
jgi:hypothetical protein